MKQKFIFYLLIFFVNTSQAMDIISALHNLENKLTQLEPFLAGEKSQKIESVPQLLANLESYVDAMERNAQALEQNLKEMLTKASSIKETDPIFKDFEKNFEKIDDNVTNCFDILTKIGNHYKKGSLSGQNIQNKLNSALGKIKKIFESLENIELDPSQTLPLRIALGNFELLKINVITVINKIILIIHNSPTISEHVTEDSKKIEELEKQIQQAYDTTLNYIAKIKTFSASGNKTELEKVIKELEDFPDNDLNALFIEIFTTATYASFIKDEKLKETLLTALKSQDLAFSQKLREETDKLGVLPEKVRELIDYIIKIVENLENQIEEAESILK